MAGADSTVEGRLFCAAVKMPRTLKTHWGLPWKMCHIFLLWNIFCPLRVLAYLLSEDLGLSVITSANEDGYENLNVHIIREAYEVYLCKPWANGVWDKKYN